jgi:hypothetical protein
MKCFVQFWSVALFVLIGLVSAALAENPYELGQHPEAKNPIDEMVFERLESLGIQPARVCSDAVFIRRTCLDLIGTLPTAREARAFIEDRGVDKRARLVDRLLQHENFADFWAMKWSEVLRVKSEYPINLWPNAVQAYHRWIRSRLGENLPYDKFARELLTASGSNFRAPPSNFYRAMQNRDPKGIATTVALVFMGERAEKWPGDRLSQMAVFFSHVGYKATSEWKEEIVFYDRAKNMEQSTSAQFPDGTRTILNRDRDPREVFADWLTNAGNPYFARNICNRIWFWLMGRGIIHEADDIRSDNPPQNPELLRYLEKELVASGYDLRHLYRLILNSAAYQLSPVPGDGRAEENFACCAIRPLEAEVLIDALNSITGSTEQYSSAIPEPFSFIPETQRAVQVADGSISSPFLEMFGRPARDTALLSERNLQPRAAQRLHLLNSSHIQKKIEQSLLVQQQAAGTKKLNEVANTLYLTVLSRFPTERELEAIKAYANSGTVSRREAVIDLTWALINTSEFLYRH